MKPEIGERFVWRQIGDSVVVVEYETGRYWTFNATATVVWKRLMEGVPVPDIAVELGADFGADVSSVMADIESFLGECRERTMLV